MSPMRADFPLPDTDWEPTRAFSTFSPFSRVSGAPALGRVRWRRGDEVMKIQVDAMIPSSRLVPMSLNKGRPVVLDEPSSEVATSIRHLAAKFSGSHEM